MKRAMWMFLLILVVVMAVLLVVTQYSWVFRKSVEGEIIEVERIVTPTTVISNGIPSQAFSFAVALRKKDGEIVTASAEDRQWAVAKKGMCVDATIDPYPPWNMDKAGTFYNARLLKLMDCHGQLADTKAASAQEPSATPAENPAATPAGQ